MKRILCFLMACTMCASAAVGLSGCGCDDNTSSNSSKPGYKVEPTEPDLTNGDFGFFIINQEELMITKYTGSDTVIEIPESYKNYKVTVIGASVFNNSKITEVTIPSSIKQIEDYAFSSCHSLTKVNLSEGLEILNNSVFFNCSELRESSFRVHSKKSDRELFRVRHLTMLFFPTAVNLQRLMNMLFISRVSLQTSQSRLALQVFPTMYSLNAVRKLQSTEQAVHMPRTMPRKTTLNLRLT
jgi:hypothetical protein